MLELKKNREKANLLRRTVKQTKYFFAQSVETVTENAEYKLKCYPNAFKLEFLRKTNANDAVPCNMDIFFICM